MSVFAFYDHVARLIQKLQAESLKFRLFNVYFIALYS